MKQAVFSLKNYSVVNVMLDLENIPPQCIFDPENRTIRHLFSERKTVCIDSGIQGFI